MKKNMLLAALLLSPLSSFAHRIPTQQDPGTRCSSNIPVSKCAPLQKLALEINCVTKEEYDALVAFGSYPSCSPDPENPGRYILLSWCKCGCFHPETKIYVNSMNDGGAPNDTFVSAIQIAESKERFTLANLSIESTVTSPKLNFTPIRTVTSGAESRPLVVIQTSLGQKLRVTERHAILKSDGTMVQAKDLKVNDELVLADGRLAQIRELSGERTTKNVVNFAVDARQPVEHIIVAEELLVGDLLWQSSLDDLQNQKLIRK